MGSGFGEIPLGGLNGLVNSGGSFRVMSARQALQKVW
jgi:hypothetical protein